MNVRIIVEIENIMDILSWPIMRPTIIFSIMSRILFSVVIVIVFIRNCCRILCVCVLVVICKLILWMCFVILISMMFIMLIFLIKREIVVMELSKMVSVFWVLEMVLIIFVILCM